MVTIFFWAQRDKTIKPLVFSYSSKRKFRYLYFTQRPILNLKKHFKLSLNLNRFVSEFVIELYQLKSELTSSVPKSVAKADEAIVLRTGKGRGRRYTQR